jgi:hypothetical protein
MAVDSGAPPLNDTPDEANKRTLFRSWNMADIDEREFFSPPVDEEPDTEVDVESATRAARTGILEASGAVEVDEATPLAATADAFAAQSLAAISADWGVGPLRIAARVSGSSVSVAVSLGGVRIANAKLSAGKPSFKVSANVGLAKAELRVVADFKRRVVVATGKVCVRVPPFRWKCRSFNVTILRW